MGYRSDVRICMLQDNFYTMIEQARPFGYTDHNYMLDEERMNVKKYKDGTVVFGWNEIKWDETLADVKFVLDFLEKMEEEGYPYALVENGWTSEVDQEYWYDGKDGTDDRCHKIELSKKIWIQEEDTEE